MAFLLRFRCCNNNAIDERSMKSPTCFGNPCHDANTNHDDDNGNAKKPSEEKSELDKLIDMIEASETENETETDEEEDWDMSDLVGESLLTNYSPDMVNTRDALYGKTVVLLYFGAGDVKTLEMLKLFDAGYHHSVLSVVYCHDNLSAFVDMPARWFAAQNVAELSASLDVTDETRIMVIEPESGDVLCENALDDILRLDTSNAAAYDEQATKLFQNWTHHMPIEQSVIGQMTIELPIDFNAERGLEETLKTDASSRAVVV